MRQSLPLSAGPDPEEDSLMSRTLITLGLATSCLAFAPNTLAATHIAQSWKLHKVSENGLLTAR